MLQNLDILTKIFSFLTEDELLVVSLVCRAWRTAARHDRVWLPLCHALWATKKFVPKDVLYSGRPAWRQFYESRLDARRERLTVEELCTFRWRFGIKSAIGIQGSMEGRFQTNGIATVGVFADMHWSIVEDNCTDSSSHPGEQQPMKISVNQYPLLTVSRTFDWGWKLENEWVVYLDVMVRGGAIHGHIEDTSALIFIDEFSAMVDPGNAVPID